MTTPSQRPGQRIERLQQHLARVDARIAQYEAIARSARGPVSKPFAERLEEARRDHARLADHLAQLRREDATSWSSRDARTGVLQVCDEIAGRIDEALEHLEKHQPSPTR